MYDYSIIPPQKLTFEPASDDEDDMVPPFYFKLQIGKINMSMTIISPEMFEITRWEQVVENIKTNKPFKMEFCVWNGDVSVIGDGSSIEFTTSRHGSGGDGSCSFDVPYDMCLEAFEQACEKLKLYEN